MPTIGQTIQKVNEFSALREGWHFGEGVPPSPERINQAVSFLEYASFNDIERANAFPGIGGQVEITFYIRDCMLEITIESDDSITIAEDREHEQISFEENLSKSDTYRRLDDFNQNLWDCSDHFIVGITTRSVLVDSPAVHWISEAENRSLSSMWNVPNRQVAPSVHILKGSTTSRPEILGSTGEYGMMICRRPVGSYQSEPRWEMTAIGTSTIGDESQLATHLSD